MDTAQPVEKPRIGNQVAAPLAGASKIGISPTASVESRNSQPLPDATVNPTVVSQEPMMQTGSTAKVEIAPEVEAADVREVSETIAQHQLPPGVEAVGDAVQHPPGPGMTGLVNQEAVAKPLVRQPRPEDLAGFFVDANKGGIWREMQIAKESVLERRN